MNCPLRLKLLSDTGMKLCTAFGKLGLAVIPSTEFSFRSFVIPRNFVRKILLCFPFPDEKERFTARSVSSVIFNISTRPLVEKASMGSSVWAIGSVS